MNLVQEALLYELRKGTLCDRVGMTIAGHRVGLTAASRLGSNTAVRRYSPRVCPTSALRISTQSKA